ncbi:unnamed protein product [Diabrotica balteata]|uniref:Uncharacterized protein n=1 Tax=Diabrotica balteata TaxID=107213 RepID=A0A9N9STY2_DIABA|nr:unnamed protein product [Diabrotica balteata]
MLATTQQKQFDSCQFRVCEESEKFSYTGSIGDAIDNVRLKTSRSNVNIEAVHESIGENLGTSIRHRGQELQILRSSLQHILTEESLMTMHSEESSLNELVNIIVNKWILIFEAMKHIFI